MAPPVLQNNVLQALSGPLGGGTAVITSAAIARAQVTYVASLANPTEFASIVGTVDGEMRLAVQLGLTGETSGAYTFYIWDSTASPTLVSPWTIAATGGTWIAVGGRSKSGRTQFFQKSGITVQISTDVNAGDSTNVASLGVGNNANAAGSVFVQYVNAAAAGAPVGRLSFQPRNNGDTTNFEAARFQFNKTAAADTGTFDIRVFDGSALQVVLASVAGTLATGRLQVSYTQEATSPTLAALATAGGLAVPLRSFLGTNGAAYKGNVIQGVQDATAAVAGQVGEVISSTVTAAAVAATGTVGNVTSISLTAGDWLISAFMNIAGGATGLTAASTAKASIVTTTATNGVDGSTMAQSSVEALVANGLKHMAIPQVRVNINTTTTYFLTEQVTFAAGAPTVAGVIIATRIR